MKKKYIYDWWSSGGGAVVEYQAVLDRATTLGYLKPTAAQQAKQNQLIIDLKSSGIWDLLDVFYVFATDGDSDYATLNWKDPSSFQIAKVNSPTFTANQGFQAVPTSYLNTGWAPSLNGVNYTLNNSAFGFHVIGNSQSDFFDIGTVGAAGITTRTWASVRTGANGTQFNISSSGALTPGSITDSSGFYHVKRSASTTTAVFKNGVSISASATTAGALSERPFFICTYNNNGTPSTPIQTRTYSMFFAGAGLNTLESSLYTAWNTYLT